MPKAHKGGKRPSASHIVIAFGLGRLCCSGVRIRSCLKLARSVAAITNAKLYRITTNLPARVLATIFRAIDFVNHAIGKQEHREHATKYQAPCNNQKWAWT